MSEETLLRIVEAIEGIRFGCVQITVHDSRVVQIEITQKIRLDHKAHPISEGRVPHPSFADQTAGDQRPLERHHDGQVLNGLACG